MTLKSLILNYRLEHEGNVSGIEGEIIEEVERLMKKHSVPEHRIEKVVEDLNGKG